MRLGVVSHIKSRIGQRGREKQLLETLDELSRIHPDAKLRGFFEDTIAYDEKREPAFADVADAIRSGSPMGQAWNIQFRDPPLSL
ncbi:MAG: hypothetical protein QF741_03480 [Candidatus Peribacteraceae bacterium]|jgi:photosystem II stability/assembly factor-like uncharacterized protein|nr:hypothetical protein [Candidatus Peribacteraceae bacterium]MDP7454343.1 hypothetical protein [Candidatus Peribacteraceae bacterium]MDP7645741.1 hypothetical protein [Candidatus Peribacteraceae bacterium]